MIQEKSQLSPLSQWICDTCEEPIIGAEKGYLEWLHSDTGRSHSFRIVHHGPASPRKPHGHCYEHNDSPGRCDMALTDFVGPAGINYLLSFLDIGEYLQRDYEGPQVSDLREFTEIFRRLHIPYYEEARQYWGLAAEEGLFEGLNEIGIYHPSTLRKIVMRFSPAEPRE